MTETTAILRERVLSGAELACIAWSVVGYGVLDIFSVEVPLLVVAVVAGVRLARWVTA